jgi:hypothetical protein
MKDPALPFDQFVRDRIILRECLIHFKNPESNGIRLSSDSSSGMARISFSCPTPDLSRFNQISFTAVNISNRSIYGEIKLFHGSGKTELIDTPISLSGGREVLQPGQRTELKYPAEAFGIYGHPDGWKNIETIEILFKPDKTDPMRDAVIVEMSSIFGENRIIPKGPRLTSIGLSTVLIKDKTYQPERLAPYSAEHPQALYIPPPHSFPREHAEEILRGRIMGRQLSCPISWNESPFGLLEWTHFLNRHHFLRNVVQALAETGDVRYVAYLDETVCDWISSNPVPVNSNGGAGPWWETLSTAWRLWEWLWIKGIAWPHASFRNTAKELMLRSFWEHAHHLMDHQGHPNNWMIVESAALTLAGMCLPEFQEADMWVEEGIRRLNNEFIRQFMDDGAHYEFSPLYQAICLHAFLDVKRAASFHNIALPDVFGTPLEKVVEYLSALCRPDFTWPSFNDSGSVAGDYTALMGLAGEMFHRKDFDWIGSKGAHGASPAETIKRFPDSGIGIMRSGYDPQAHFLAFRAGPAGMTHVHEDALSLEVVAHGIPCLIDPGITRYAPGPMTDYYRSAASHNALLLDGKGPLRSRLGFQERTRSARNQFTCFNRGDVIGMSGTCNDYRDESGAGFQITRSVLFVAHHYWVIRDTAIGAGIHTLTACWQFFPGNVEMDAGTLIIRSMDQQGKGMALIPHAGFDHAGIQSFKGNLNPPRGWVSINGEDIPARHFRFSVRDLLPITLDWILCPVSQPCHAFWESPDFASRTADLFRHLHNTTEKNFP